ncbi:MAG: M3 family oligoendopeptidase [Bacilli bacterium]|jgi:pepF/M3 family oligoendopeptidase|nr:M3 family oligoendopeptidase [Bacilli bacterium]HHU24799.1 M3 family oligoendopeptidase [Acholeplasmataceae bacterium]
MYQWDLTPFYRGFDDPKFNEDIESFFAMVEQAVEAFSLPSTNKVSFLEEALKRQEKIYATGSKIYAFINLNSSADTQNLEPKKALVRMQPISSKLALLEKKLQSFIEPIENLDEIINQSKFLKQYEFIIKSIKEDINHSMSEELEMLATEMVQNGSSLWSQMQRHLTSTTEIEFQGKPTSLTQLRNMAYDPDSNLRKAAYEKELELYKLIEEPISFAISGIKGEVNTLSPRRNFASALEETLYKSRLKKETLDALLSAMKESLPDFCKYLKHKAKLLGHSENLPWYDLFAPMGKSDTKYSVEDAQDFIIKQFKTFGDDLANLAKRAFEQNWVDYFPRKGKVGGAFCMNSAALKQSRILTNYDGTIGDIITLAHELGHAYHGEQIFKEAILNSSYTMPVAETASTLCETITKKAVYKEAKTKEEKIHILEQELQDTTQVIVDIYSRFLFEQSVFEARKKSIPSAKELNNLMVEAQKEAYGDGLNHQFPNPGMWINKSHYYRGGLSFYNFPYAFGLLFAKGIYAKFMEMGPKFVEDVNMLLRSTGKMTVEDAAKVVGIDLTDPSFWKKGLATIKQDIEEFIAITSEV